MQSTEDVFIGRIVAARYRLVRCVGRGGMGAVYEGIHVQTEKRVAVKILAQHLSKDLKLIARFRREAMAASRLDHENCVRVYDFGEDNDGTFYIAMEFVDGQGLGSVIRHGGPMGEPRVCWIGVQLLSALDAAHGTGILHRDLKPQNIMLTKVAGRPDVIKVVDFGIAKFISNSKEDQAALTVPGTIFGTPEYMSPEQARGEELDGRSDLYSAATVLWHLLLGRSPFRGKTVRETLTKVFGEPPPSARGERPSAVISAEFETCLARALEKEREERYPDAASFLAALQAFNVGYGGVDPTPQRVPVPGIAPDGSAPETLAGEEATDPKALVLHRHTDIGHVGGSAAPLPAPPLASPPLSPPGPRQPKGPTRSDAETQTLHDDNLLVPEVNGAPVVPAPVEAVSSAPGPRHDPSANPPDPSPGQPGDLSDEGDGHEPDTVLDGSDTLDGLELPSAFSPGAKRAMAAASGVLLVGLAVWGAWSLLSGDPSTGGGGDGDTTPLATGPDITAPPPAGYQPDPEVFDESMKLAEGAKSEGYLQLARKQFERAVAADLDNAKAHMALIVVYLELQELDLAAKHVKRLEQIDPDRYRAQIEFARRAIDLRRAQAKSGASAP